MKSSQSQLTGVMLRGFRTALPFGTFVFSACYREERSELHIPPSPCQELCPHHSDLLPAAAKAEGREADCCPADWTCLLVPEL